jgi:hypothetical protein
MRAGRPGKRNACLGFDGSRLLNPGELNASVPMPSTPTQSFPGSPMVTQLKASVA